jgi:nitrile hydratase beta subunit
VDGLHDMGGSQSFGRVDFDPTAPVFAERWEGRAFALGALSIGLSGANLDAFRHALERLHPLDYLGDGYYGRWLAAAELLLTDSGVIPPGSVEARARVLAGHAVDEPADVGVHKPSSEPGGGGSLRQIGDVPAYADGEEVRARDLHTPGHCRMPAYVRGRRGVVIARRPAAVLPDATAHFRGEEPQHVYTVEFDSTELWGPDAEVATVRVDLFESYLEAAS